MRSAGLVAATCLLAVAGFAHAQELAAGQRQQDIPASPQPAQNPQPAPKEKRQPYARQPEELRPVTVAELFAIVPNMKKERDARAAKEIDNLQVTERLSSAKMATLSAELPGAKSKAALLAVGDQSAFLDPPADEIPREKTPDMAEQKMIMTRVVEYLRTMIPKLPNFYARRVTASFEDVWSSQDSRGTHKQGALHSAGQFKATVYVRSGEEVVHADGAQERGLITRGTFGPILSTVIIDAANSNDTQWSRWEAGPGGPIAVFQFDVPQQKSHYQVSGSGEFSSLDSSAYHGEIGVDPNSGAILRLVLKAEPGLGSSIESADVMVEYGAVAIGDKVYTCPVRSVSYSVGVSQTNPFVFGPSSDRHAARLNDVVFSDYHVFRSSFRILPYTP